MYALPPQILPCDDVDLLDLQYLNADFAPVKHPFKSSFDIESYNSMRFDKQPPSTCPALEIICNASLPTPIVEPVEEIIIHTPRPDTIGEMDASLTPNDSINEVAHSICSAAELPSTPIATPSALHQSILNSNFKLCFIAYCGANTLRPRWYLIQIQLDDSDDVISKGL